MWHRVGVEQTKARTYGVGLLIAVLALPAGFVILEIVQLLVHKMWFELPQTLGTSVLWLVTLGVPTLAGLAVVWLRRHGNDGHSPVGGISFAPVSARDYPTVIGAIVVSLAGGLVLGPEAAMVCTGAVIGTVVGSKFGLPIKTSVGFGSAAAILALLVTPIKDGTFTVASTYQFRFLDLLGALLVGLITAVVIMIGRLLALRIGSLSGAASPTYVFTAGAALVVGLLAMVYHSVWGQDVVLVLTSGEGSVKQLLALGSVGMILITVAFKWLAYSISMGSGFRGGPFFPSIFVGAGIGGVVGLIGPDIASGAAVAGMVAAVVYLAHPGWVGVVVIAVPLSLIGGGVELIPLGLVAAVVAKLVPEVSAKQEVENLGAGDQDRTGTTSLEG